jgi:hypothetical protein
MGRARQGKKEGAENKNSSHRKLLERRAFANTSEDGYSSIEQTNADTTSASILPGEA